MIQVVIFDIDGVLVSVRSADAETYKEMLNSAGYDLPDETEIQSVVQLPLWEGVKRLLGTNDVQEINRVRDILLDREVGHRDLIPPIDGVHETLSELAKDYRLAVVTSRFRQNAQEVLEELHLTDFFEQIVCYEDTNEHKPHPDPLLLAAQVLGIHPHIAVYVGDMDYDVHAANAAGMKSVHISKVREPTSTAWIERLDQLPELLQSTS